MWRSGGGRGALRSVQRQLVLGFSSSAAVGPAAEISAAASSLQAREFRLSLMILHFLVFL